MIPMFRWLSDGRPIGSGLCRQLDVDAYNAGKEPAVEDDGAADEAADHDFRHERSMRLDG